jgi:hypothetical protein
MACLDLPAMSATASTSPPPTEPLTDPEGLSTLAIRPAPTVNPNNYRRIVYPSSGAQAAAPTPHSLGGYNRPTPLAAPKRRIAVAPAALLGSHRAPGTKPQAERRAAARLAPAFSEKVPAAEGLEDCPPPAHTSRFLHTSAQYHSPSEEMLVLEKTEELLEPLAEDDVVVGADAGAAGATSLRRPSRIFLAPETGRFTLSKPAAMATGALFQACAELRRRADTPALRVSAAAHFISLCLKVR